jgi:hypothetical protein
MESFHGEQPFYGRADSWDIKILVKELQLLECPLPNKFVARCMIAKLASSWRNLPLMWIHAYLGMLMVAPL